MGIALKGDFIGFWIDDIHSSELGIIRTSDGSRFNENLLPTIQDKTVQVPGGDGFYYFGSYYTQRPFNIPIAFDNMEESQFRRLKQILGSKKMVKLVFDEAPYKYYSVKSTGTPTLKYICFDVEVDNQGGSVDDVYAQTSTAATKRVYKGEGTLSFVAYDPFGYARAVSIYTDNSLSDYNLKLPNNELITNKEDWVFSIAEGDGEYQYPLPNAPQTGAFTTSSGVGELAGFHNSGDLPADYQIFCECPVGGTITIINSRIEIENGIEQLDPEASLALQLKTASEETQTGFCFDSKTNCVYGWNKDTGKIDYDHIYNKYLIAARFDKLPVGSQTLWTFGVTTTPIINIKYKYF